MTHSPGEEQGEPETLHDYIESGVKRARGFVERTTRGDMTDRVGHAVETAVRTVSRAAVDHALTTERHRTQVVEGERDEARAERDERNALAPQGTLMRDWIAHQEHLRVVGILAQERNAARREAERLRQAWRDSEEELDWIADIKESGIEDYEAERIAKEVIDRFRSALAASQEET